MKKLFVLILTVLTIATCLHSCTAADNVNFNLSMSADNFQVLRKITVYNARTDLIVLEMEGFMSLSNSNANELIVTCRTGESQYKKNYVYLNEYVIYVVEDITGTNTDPYHYSVKFYVPAIDVDVNPKVGEPDA